MARMSNRDRIARAAEEAKAAEAEKVAKKTVKKATGVRAKRPAASVRVKIVWEIWNVNGTTVKSFPYSDKAEAEAMVQSLTRSTGRTHILRPTKVPME
jgi:phospholipase C